MIPALKTVIGLATGDAGWGRLRPPLAALDDAAVERLSDVLDRHGFAMPGRRDAA